MKTRDVVKKESGLSGLLIAAAAALFAGSGCVVATYDDPTPPTTVNYAPVIYDAGVSCGYDSAYGEYFWDLFAFVDDPDYDVVDVYAEVYDYYTGDYLETHRLAYDYEDQWSNTIYETYSNYLSCPFAEEFDFDIYAVDSYGDADVVSVYIG